MDVQPYLTPAVALIGAMSASFIAWRFGSIQADIARQQARTAQNKLKLDLFDKRVAVYNAIAEYINLSPESVAERGGMGDYIPRFAPVKWLFDEKIADWLYGELLPQVAIYHLEGAMLVFVNGHPVDMQQYTKFNDMGAALQDQHLQLANLFRPYLQLEHGPST